MSKVDNAVIMAAGTSSRFAPLSYERPKALTEVRGEILIERQIRQLRNSGIDQICIVTGYMPDRFEYLKGKYGVELLHNPDYLFRNNNGSIWVAREVIRNTYICSGDNYFTENPFEAEVEGACYSAVYAREPTNEWCMETDPDGYIRSVRIGGTNAWYMLGHVFWDAVFSSRFLTILEQEYSLPETADKLWETIYIEHIHELPMRMRKYPDGMIYEFDTLDELRKFDPSYIKDTRSEILKSVAAKLCAAESDLLGITALRGADNTAAGFTFLCKGKHFAYHYEQKKLEVIGNG